MINFIHFYKQIEMEMGPLKNWLKILPVQIEQWERNNQHRQSQNWRKIVQTLPKLTPNKLELKTDVIAKNMFPLCVKEKNLIKQLLVNLMPWRKGPFFLYDIKIDSEWRSDWKWQRIIPHISSLTNKLILDVGCGNGYYMWRMIGEGAKSVIGIDPNQLFLYQFEAIRKLIGNDQRVHLLPLSIEQLPSLAAFDIVFSMGVIYHRRTPLNHLYQLKNQLVSGGELILESLVIEGDENKYLIPSERYAKMRNIYLIPSAKMLKVWLQQCGFYNVKIVNQSLTTIKEQRKTDWISTKSLGDFLDPNNPRLTIEGYDAPMRAILIAQKGNK